MKFNPEEYEEFECHDCNGTGLNCEAPLQLYATDGSTEIGIANTYKEIPSDYYAPEDFICTRCEGEGKIECHPYELLEL